jgi:hypothetical protein
MLPRFPTRQSLTTARPFCLSCTTPMTIAGGSFQDSHSLLNKGKLSGWAQRFGLTRRFAQSRTFRRGGRPPE